MDNHHETQSETSDGVSFVRILWCSCIMQIEARSLWLEREGGGYVVIVEQLNKGD